MYTRAAESGELPISRAQKTAGGVPAMAQITQLPLGEVVAEGVGGRIGPAVRADLLVEILDMPVDGAGADGEGRRDLAVAAARRNQPQHIDLACGEATWIGGLRRSRLDEARVERIGAGEGGL